MTNATIFWTILLVVWSGVGSSTFLMGFNTAESSKKQICLAILLSGPLVWLAAVICIVYLIFSYCVKVLFRVLK